MNNHDDMLSALRAIWRRFLPVMAFLPLALPCAAGAVGAESAKDQASQTKTSASAQAPKTTPPAKQAQQAASKDAYQYDRLLRAENFDKYRSTEAVHKIQEQLHLIYQDDPDFQRDVALGYRPLNDNIMGPVTLFWMQRYCYTFKIEPLGNFADSLVESIDSFAGFAERHPDDKKIILTHDFGKWMDLRPANQLQADYAIRRNGSDTDRIALVEEYLKRSPKPVAKRYPNQIFSYRLDDADLDILRAKSAILQDLSAFPSKPFADVGEFDTAVLAALKDVPPDVAKSLLPDIESAAKVGGYRVTDASIQRMQDVGVPDELVHTVDPLMGVLYLQRSDLEAAMESAAATAKEDAAFNKNRSKMIAAAEIGTYSLDADALAKLAADFSDDRQKPLLPLPIIDILKSATNVNYPIANLFDKAATAKIWYSLGTCMSNTPSYNNYLRNLALKDDDFAALKDAVVKSVAGSDAKANADMGSRFDAMVALRKLTDVCTTDQIKSAQTLAADVYQFYRPTIADIVRKSPPPREEPVRWSGGSWGFKDGAITSSCGCVLEDLSGQVYSFYPFWMAPPKPAQPAKDGDTGKAAASAKANDNPPQLIDFNVNSRIGFVGFTFDDNGDLKPAPNRYDNDYDFAGVAQGFRSKVDWVIRRDDWTGWNALSNREQTERFKKLSRDIVAFLGKAGGNGVTLFFDGYPSFDELSESNDNAINEFDDFVKELNDGLRATGKDYGLNIVMRQPSESRKDKDNSQRATAKVDDYDNMLKLLGLINPDDSRRKLNIPDNELVSRIYTFVKPQLTSQTRNHILLLIEEPTIDAKKRLRLEIEQSLHGEDRHMLLSGVIPVIEFDGRNWQQLEDDIIYFKDNFDGIGFWPVNFHQTSTAPPGAASVGDNHCDHGETVEQCLVRAYQGYNLNGKEDSLVQKFVCQFHDWFRAVYVLQLLVFLVAYLVPLFTCHMRDWISSHFKLLVANFFVMMVVGALLFIWDPGLNGAQAHLIIIVALVFAIAFEAVRRRQEFIARAVKPSRARSAMADHGRRATEGEDDATGGESDKRHRLLGIERSRERYTGVLKSAIRLRTYVESGKPADADLRRELKSDLAVLQSYLEIDEKEGINTRIKIMKAAQVVIAHADDAHSPVSDQKMRRLALLLWSYLNGNIEAERQVLVKLEPFLEIFEEGSELAQEKKGDFAQVLHDAQVALADRDQSATGRFEAMKTGIAQMRQNVDTEGRATPAVASSMQVVWDYLDHDEMLHGSKEIAHEQKTAPELADLRNELPITP